MREGVIVSLIGSILGFVTAFVGIRLVSHNVFAIPAMDVATMIVVPLILAAVVLLACYVPARRAARVDPMVVLRWL
jgi:putative ABC transport system permease protein